MAKKIQTNQKHMTQDDRVTIEKCLDAKKNANIARDVINTVRILFPMITIVNCDR